MSERIAFYIVVVQNSYLSIVIIKLNLNGKYIKLEPSHVKLKDSSGLVRKTM